MQHFVESLFDGKYVVKTWSLRVMDSENKGEWDICLVSFLDILNQVGAILVHIPATRK